jgi:hypothetical protein
MREKEKVPDKSAKALFAREKEEADAGTPAVVPTGTQPHFAANARDM